MARHRITLEVDGAAMFDACRALQSAGGEWGSSIGYHISSVLMTGAQPSLSEAIGLAVFGIEVVSIEALPAAAAPAKEGANDDDTRT